MSNAKAKWREKLASMPCVVGKEHGGCEGRVELHHVAEGSGLRHDYGLVPLCSEHHRGQAGLHGMGPRNFLRLYRPPGESEYGLLIWLLEQMAKS
jgi:RecA-dependent nuclease